MTAGSNMPAYPHFAVNKVNFDKTGAKLAALSTVGVPYTPQMIDHAADDAKKQAAQVAKDLSEQGIDVPADAEVVAIIAYLQSLGLPPTAPAPAPEPQKPTAMR
jgi:cytochrome c oxidase cbb3-type subunit I/II